MAAPPSNILHPKAVEGIELFNAGHYFEAHEALEAAWNAEPGELRDLYRGILQIAVAYLHIQRSNYRGALKLHARSQRWLAPFPAEYAGINVAQLKADFEAAIAETRRLGPEGLIKFDFALLKPLGFNSLVQQTVPRIPQKVCRNQGIFLDDD